MNADMMLALVSDAEPVIRGGDRRRHRPSRLRLYRERGGQDGHDADDWLEAERELRAAVS